MQVLKPVQVKPAPTVPPIFQQTDVIGMVVGNPTDINLTLVNNQYYFKTRLLDFYRDHDKINGNLTVQVIKRNLGKLKL